MSKIKKNNYTEDSIQVLEGLEAVRKRPGMYIGSTSQDGLHHLLWELLDNTIDEVMGGFANEIKIIHFPDNAILVKDNGRGIPVGINKTTQLSTVDTVFTTLHAGGKFNDSAYKVAGGLHGVGASVVNALSSLLIVEVHREQKVYQAQYENGGKIIQPLKIVGKTNTTGTQVFFKPDTKIFPSIEFNKNTIIERLREASFLFPNLAIEFISQDREKHIFHANNGIHDYVQFINESKKIVTPICYFQGIEEQVNVEIAFQYTDSINETIISFANSIKTKEGGSHEIGFKNAIVDCLNEFGKKQKILKNNQILDLSDVREGLTAVIVVQIPENILLFEGQTKAKLFTVEAKNAVQKIISIKFLQWLHEHKDFANKIIQKVLQAQTARLAAKKAREEVRKIKDVKSNRMLAGKLTPAQSKNPKEREIFLVEGESAGGSAKTCRNKFSQAILPLKGKIINVEKARLIDLLGNEEITSIITALGVGFGKEINLSNLNYYKIIIMTDADDDGAHIQTLLLTLFFRYMKPLIEKGHIYVANPPLYKVTHNKSKSPIYLWTINELNQIRSKYSSIEIKRFKGLGEMEEEQLWDTTMDPEKRQLIQIKLSDLALVERRITTLMGDDANARREWINDNVQFHWKDE